MGEITAVFFDIGGVLLEIDPERTLQAIAGKTGVDRELVRANFPLEALHSYEKGEITGGDFYGAVRRALPGNNLAEADFWAAWDTLVGSATPVVDILYALLPHYPVWLLSNTNARHIRRLSGKVPFFRAVRGAFYSFEMGSRKPEPEIYHRALQVTDCKPEAALFIDDMPDNVTQARKIGMQALRYTGVPALQAGLKKMGVAGIE